MDSKTVNELQKSLKSNDPNILGRAYVRSYSLGKSETNQGMQKVMPPLIEAICEKAVKDFHPGTPGYETFIKYPSLLNWVDRNRYFTQCQQASFQRDTILLKGYADRFNIAEKVINANPSEETLEMIKDYTVDSFLKGASLDPFDDKANTNEGNEICDRLKYSLSWVVAYNTTIELSAKLHGVPELIEYSINLEEDIELLRDVDRIFKRVDISISNNHNYNDDDKFSMVSKIREFTRFVDDGGLELNPSAEALATMTMKIKDFSGYSEDYILFADAFPIINEVLFDE